MFSVHPLVKSMQPLFLKKLAQKCFAVMLITNYYMFIKIGIAVPMSSTGMLEKRENAP